MIQEPMVVLYPPRGLPSPTIPWASTSLQASEKGGWADKVQLMVLDSSDGLLNKIGPSSCGHC